MHHRRIWIVAASLALALVLSNEVVWASAEPESAQSSSFLRDVPDEISNVADELISSYNTLVAVNLDNIDIPIDQLAEVYEAGCTVLRILTY